MSNKYLLLEPLNLEQNLGEISQAAFWRVSVAFPLPGSITERVREGVEIFDAEDIGQAVSAFMKGMSETGMRGVLDSHEIRVWAADAEDFRDSLNEEISRIVSDLSVKTPFDPLTEAVSDFTEASVFQP